MTRCIERGATEVKVAVYFVHFIQYEYTARERFNKIDSSLLPSREEKSRISSRSVAYGRNALPRIRALSRRCFI